MKVGDLVELSAYGRKKRYDNRHLMDKIGLVVAQHPGGFYWKVHWFQTNNHPFHISRRDIKHVKVKKST